MNRLGAGRDDGSRQNAEVLYPARENEETKETVGDSVADMVGRSENRMDH